MIEFLDPMQSVKMQALNRNFYKIVVPRLLLKVPGVRLEECILIYHKKYIANSKIISVIVGKTEDKNELVSE